MEKEYDFSKGERGKFYRENIKLNLPIYLESDIREFVEHIAARKGLDVGTIVNTLIKKNMQLVNELT